jgi:hypothetical protein
VPSAKALVVNTPRTGVRVSTDPGSNEPVSTDPSVNTLLVNTPAAHLFRMSSQRAVDTQVAWPASGSATASPWAVAEPEAGPKLLCGLAPPSPEASPWAVAEPEAGPKLLCGPAPGMAGVAGHAKAPKPALSPKNQIM